MKNNKYLITGINGYMASYLVKYIKETDKNSKIYGIIRKESDLRPDLEPFIEEIFYYDKDLLKYTDKDKREIDFSNFNAVFHLATNFKSDDSLKTIQTLIEDNLLATISLYKQIENSNKQPHLIVTSSWSAYKCNEIFSPNNVYSATKYYAEDSSKIFNLHKLTFLRISDTYGKYDTRPKIHNLLTRPDNPITSLNSPKNQKINMTHIEDVCRALLYSYKNKFYGKADLYYKENEISLDELVKLLKLKDIKFGNKEVIDLPNQVNILKDFKLKHNINNIYKDLKG